MNRALVPLVALVALNAQAASLKELLEAAESGNVDRKITTEQRLKAANDVRLAWSALLPSLTVSGNWTNNQYPTEITLGPQPPIVITPKNQLDGIFRFELPLIDTGRWFRASASEHAESSAEARDELARDGVRRQVTATYYAFAAALSVREAAKRSVSVAEAQQQLQEVRFQTGVATELEVLRAKAELQRNRQTVADTDVLVANTRRALLTLTGTDVGEMAFLPEDNLTPEGALAELEGKISELPGVKAAEADARAAGTLATAAKLNLVPIVTANFTERITNATGFTGRADSYTAGVGLVWRIDGPGLFNIRGQALTESVAKLAVERQKLALRDQVHTDWQRLNAAIQKVTAAKAQVESATRAAQVAKDRYTAGAATQIDVIQSERDLFSAQVNHIQARTELASSHVALRLSAGLPLNVQ